MSDNTAITLDTPLQRGDAQITEVVVRKPKSGELRGCSLAALLNLDVDALQVVLPRVTSPLLTKADVANLDPADMVQLGTAVAGFLLTRAVKDPAYRTE